MGTNEKFCLRWNDFESNISVAFKEIREEKDFFDCTISVGDRQLQAHKLILSACSPFFRSVLRKNPHPHPLLYLKGVEFSDLQSVLNFMYHGEVNVAQEELNSFLAVAEDLKVKGLTQNNSSNINSAPKHSSRAVEDPPRSNPVPRNVPTEPQAPKRPRPIPQYSTSTQHQQDDDDIQEVMPVVKTEPVVDQQQPPVTTYQQSVVQQTNSYSDTEGQVTGGALTQMEDQTIYEENDGYDYGGYEEGYQGADVGEGNSGLNEVISSMIVTAEGGHSCTVCGKIFHLMGNAKMHVEAKHVNTGGFPCTLCGFISKTRNSLRMHMSNKHKTQ